METVKAVAWFAEHGGPNGGVDLVFTPAKGATNTPLYTAQQFLELVDRAMPAELSTERFAAMFADGHSSGCHKFLTNLTALVGEMEKGK
jgi:hypothetical protein